MKNDTCHEEPGLEGDFPGREKHGRDACVARVARMATPGLRAAGTAQRNVFPAASTDGFTAARKLPSQSRLRSMKKLPFANNAGQGFTTASTTMPISSSEGISLNTRYHFPV